MEVRKLKKSPTGRNWTKVDAAVESLQGDECLSIKPQKRDGMTVAVLQTALLSRYEGIHTSRNGGSVVVTLTG